MKFVSLCMFCLCYAPLYVQALVLDDFAPGFVNSSSQIESPAAGSLIAFSLPESSGLQQDSSKITESAWSCNKASNSSCSTKLVSSAVIAQGVKLSTVAAQQPVSLANQGSNDQYFNRNGNSFDQNAINNFNITNSNQTTMQAYSAQLNNTTIEDKLKQNIAIPLSTGSHSAVSVGTNNVQFNVSY